MGSAKDETLRAFGRSVRARRQALGLSQEQLAARAGIGRSYVTDIETGIRNVALWTIVRLATALGTAPSALLGEVDRLPAWQEHSGG